MQNFYSKRLVQHPLNEHSIHMNQYRFILSLFISILLTFNSMAQISQGGFPLPEKLQGASLRHFLSNDVIEMPPFDFDSIKNDSISMKVGGVRFAYGFKVNITPQNSGITTFLPDGGKVWRAKIHSEDATSINLIFDKFHLPEGAKLFIYTPDRSQIIGAFTNENNHEDGKLATSPIEGDEIVVEYYEPKNQTGEIAIGQVNHGFRSLTKSLTSYPEANLSQSCNVNVNCIDVPDIASRSTVLIIFNGSVICSGALINNSLQDNTPYVLSAAHCIEETSTKTINDIASTTIFYFNYENPYCFDNSIRSSFGMSVSGAKAVDIQKSFDLLLLQLNEFPPFEYNSYLAGWNIQSDILSQVYTVHHPQGDTKRYSLSKTTPEKTTFICCDNEPMFSNDGHWGIDEWEMGITEGGSSGAPLFDDQARIIGALSGGYDPSGCQESNYDCFYRINKVWNSRSKNLALSTWLDPSQSKIQTLSGKEPYGSSCKRITHYEREDQPILSQNDVYLAGTNNNGIQEFAERYNQPGVIYGVHFLPEEGTYTETDTIWLKIYQGDNFPELIYKQRVRVFNSYYNTSKKTTISELQKDLSSCYNYVHLDTPVKVDSSFLVAIELPKKATYPFAICGVQKETNTAYYKKGDKWFELNTLEPFNEAASLLIEPRMQTSNPTYQHDIINEASSIVYPNPAKDKITLSLKAKARKITLQNITGQVLQTKENITGEYEMSLSSYPNGMYILTIDYASTSETVKILKE